ncbi:MAG: hypothetical protein LBH13_01465 [Cellulomonadaceae bacterium]|jgi:hypothetical protein|nr:hypothetical protein [Cellulomonadaceae bacterium]
MNSEWITPLLGRQGPFATVVVDAMPSGHSPMSDDVAAQREALVASLTDQGAPQSVIAALEAAALHPTRRAGAHGRMLIADATGVVVDRPLRHRPPQPSASWAFSPYLIRCALAADDEVSTLRVAVDHDGADLLVAGPHAWELEQTVWAPGSTAERAFDRAARSIAGMVEETVAEESPELICLWGEPLMMAAVKAALTRGTADLVVEIPGGRRDAFVPPGPFRDNFESAIKAFRDRRREGVLSAFRFDTEATTTVTGLDEVRTSLMSSSVSNLVIAVDTAQDAIDREDATLVPLILSAAGQGAGITFAPDGFADLLDGVGATLR